MKVLQFSGAMGWGGNEQQLVDLVFGLQKLKVENCIFCFNNSALEAYAKQHDLDYYCVPKAKGYSLSYLSSFKTFLEQYQPDIVHLHTSDSVTAFVLAHVIFKFDIPAVFSKKGIGGSSSFLSKLKYNHRSIEQIVCVSGAVKNAFKKLIKPANHSKLKVVYDGIKIERAAHKNEVNLRAQFSIPDSKIIIGNIANHTRAKDLITFVETVNEMVNNQGIKNVHFIQIGKEGKYSKEFMPLIAKYKLEDYITIAGFQKNAMDLLSQLDVYLMTSEREGLPITIYEAFYKKIPVVSTRAGGIPEAITHNENGLLCNIKDWKSLANNLKRLIEDESLQQVFTEKSYALLMENFTTKQLAENMVEIYKNSLHD